MFDVPIEKIDKKSPLRDKGKVADLACIAEGQLVLTDKGLVPIERVTLAHKVWDGYSFVNHDGVIYKGVKEVITYEGLTATKDHLVWIEGQTQPVQFEYAATSGSHLIQTGNGRSPIRLGENYKPRKEMEQEYESLQSPNPVCKLRANTMDIIKQSSKRHFQRMSKMLSTKTNSTVVRQKINCSKTKMRKPKDSAYKNYGQRGIKFNFPSVLEAGLWIMENLGLPDRSLELDRINNNGHYEPGNIRFVTRQENSVNKRNTVLANWNPTEWPYARTVVIRKLSQGMTKEEIIEDAKIAVLHKRKNWRIIDARLDFMTY